MMKISHQKIAINFASGMLIELFAYLINHFVGFEISYFHIMTFQSHYWEEISSIHFQQVWKLMEIPK